MSRVFLSMAWYVLCVQVLADMFLGTRKVVPWFMYGVGWGVACV